MTRDWPTDGLWHEEKDGVLQRRLSCPGLAASGDTWEFRV